MFIAEHTTKATDIASSVMVADLYAGAGDNEPRSHVAKMPPELVIMNPIAIAVALRVCGAELLEFQADSDGAMA
jgi:hypothetical protein